MKALFEDVGSKQHTWKTAAEQKLAQGLRSTRIGSLRPDCSSAGFSWSARGYGRRFRASPTEEGGLRDSVRLLPQATKASSFSGLGGAPLYVARWGFCSAQRGSWKSHECDTSISLSQCLALSAWSPVISSRL